MELLTPEPLHWYVTLLHYEKMYNKIGLSFYITVFNVHISVTNTDKLFS